MSRGFAGVPFDVLSFNSFLFRSFSDKSFNSPPNDFSDIVMGKAPKQLRLKTFAGTLQIEVIDLLSQFSERINKTFGTLLHLARYYWSQFDPIGTFELSLWARISGWRSSFEKWQMRFGFAANVDF